MKKKIYIEMEEEDCVYIDIQRDSENNPLSLCLSLFLASSFSSRRSTFFTLITVVFLSLSLSQEFNVYCENS